MSSADVAEATARRPRVLVLNQYYAPGIEATAQLLTELCEELASDFDITVVTGLLRDRPISAGEVVIGGVRTVRVRSASFERVRLIPRAINYFTYLVQSLRASLRRPRPDVVLCMTDPPVIGAVGVVAARRFRVPVVVVMQDVFPEIAVELGRLKNGVLVTMLRIVTRWYLRRADRIVAIGEVMREKLISKGASPARIEVIPNWVDATRLQPAPRQNAWSAQHGLDRSFVVMHSGNLGHAHDLDNLVHAATLLRDLEDIQIVIIGSGARQHEVRELVARLGVSNVRFFPYQDRSVLSLSLSSADVHFVGLARGLAGYVVPSRFLGILAVGRPVIAAVDEMSETARMVREQECGLAIPPGDPQELAATIRAAHNGEHDLAAMGDRGRRYVAEEATKSVSVARYRELLHRLISAAASEG